MKILFSIVSMLLIFEINYANANETIEDKFKIAVGGYSVFRYDSTFSLTDKNLGAGVSINPEDALDLSTEQTVVRLDGYYRINEKHAITYSWFKISSFGNKSLEEEIDWVDENGDPVTIPVGARIDTSLDYDIYKIGYLWSFYHNEKVELAAGVGLHITRISIGLSAEATSSGVNARDVSTTVPLPVLSSSLTYHVGPKFQWYLKSEMFSLSYDEWNGIYADNSVVMEYRAFKHVGFGLGLGSNTLKVIEETNDYKFTYDNRITGALFYVAAYY